MIGKRSIMGPILDRYRKLLDETSDQEILDQEAAFEKIMSANPLVYETLKPVWLERLKKAKKN